MTVEADAVAAEKPAAGRAHARAPQARRFRIIAWAPVIVLIALCIIIAAINPNFLSLGNFVRISQAAMIPLVLGMGATFIILMGSIDLSVEGILTLAAVMISVTVLNGANGNDFGLLGVRLVLLVGAAVGFVNGVVHVRLKIPSFMATLGMWFIGVGVANVILGGLAVRINDPMIRGLAIERFLGLPWGVWLALGLPRRRLRHPGPHAARPLHLCARRRRGTGGALGHSGGAHAHPGLHHRRHVLRGRRHPRRRPARPRQCADRQRPAVHHDHRRRRRRHRADRRAGQRAADAGRRADRRGALERHGADGHPAHRPAGGAGADDHRRGGDLDRPQAHADRQMSAAATPALALRHVEKRFPGVHALKDVSIEIRPNEVVGLVGENGAGKSTLMRVLAGVYQPDSGDILLAGQKVRLTSATNAMRQGIGMVFQEQSLLTNLTVGENIYLGNEAQFTRFGIVRWSALYAAARRQIAKVQVDIDPRTRTAELDFATRQMVELAKALTLEERAEGHLVILLDEPTSVLERADIDILFSRVRALKARASFIFVSHRLDEVLELSDRVYVMKDGAVVAELAAAEADVPKLHQLMVGRGLQSEYYREPQQKPHGETVVLRAEGLTLDGAYQRRRASSCMRARSSASPA